jgi:hypothetical protein
VINQSELEKHIETLDNRIAEEETRMRSLGLRGRKRRECQSFLENLKSLRESYAQVRATQIAGSVVFPVAEPLRASAIKRFRWWVDDPATGRRVLTTEKLDEAEAHRRFGARSTRPHWPSAEVVAEPLSNDGHADAPRPKELPCVHSTWRWE